MAWHNIGRGTATELIAIVNLEIIRRETERPETKQASLREFETELRERLNTPAHHDAYIEAAREYHHSEGDLEIEPDALVSTSEDNGAYVMAWQWVSNSEANICDTCGEHYDEGGDGFDGNCPSCADYTDQVEDPDSYFAIEDWRSAVAEGNTEMSYRDWRGVQIADAQEKLDARKAGNG